MQRALLSSLIRPRVHLLTLVGALTSFGITAWAQSDLPALMKEGKNWPMAARDYANTRFSALDQINTSNVHDLHLAWSFSVGPSRGQEAAPLVVEGVIYVVAPYDGPHPNQVFALDAVTG